MSNWKDVESKEAEAFSRGEFQGKVMEALQGIEKRMGNMERDKEIKGYINYFVSALVAGIVAFFTRKVT